MSRSERFKAMSTSPWDYNNHNNNKSLIEKKMNENGKLEILIFSRANK